MGISADLSSSAWQSAPPVHRMNQSCMENFAFTLQYTSLSESTNKSYEKSASEKFQNILCNM